MHLPSIVALGGRGRCQLAAIDFAAEIGHGCLPRWLTQPLFVNLATAIAIWVHGRLPVPLPAVKEIMVKLEWTNE